MDAAQKLLKNTALFLVTTLLVAAGVAHAQPTLTANPSSVTLTTNQAVQVAIGSSDGSVVPYTVASQPAWISPISAGNSGSSIAVALISSCTAVGCSGNIVLHPTNGAANLTIPVTYSPGSGGGGGVLSSNPTSVSLTVANGGSSNSFTTISTTGSAVNISTVTNPVPWLSCFLGATQVSAGNSTTLTIQVNGANYSNSTQNSACTVTPSTGANLVVNVTMVVGTSSSGNFQLSQNNIPFSFPCGTCQAFVQVNNSSTNSFNFQVSSTNNWLLASGTSANNGNGVSLSVNTSVASTLATGGYTGTVLLTNSSNSSDTATIVVNLSVNGGSGSGIFSPSSLTFSASLNGATQAQTVTINSGTLTFASNNGCSWVGVSQLSSNQLTVQIFPSSLFTPNTYTCSVIATVSGTNYTLPVTLFLGTSGGGGGGTGGTVAPTSLTFSGQAGAANAPSYQQITVTGSGAITVGTTYGGGTTPFISATANGSAPGSVFVYVTSGLGVGTYSGTLSITVNGITQNVPVTYTVSSNVAAIASPATINVSSDNGSPIAPILLSMTASDNSALSVSLQSSATWVTFNSATGVTPSNFLVNINPVGLPNGVNSATITANVSGAANNPMIIPVVVLVNGSTGGTGNLTLSSSNLSFNTTINGGNPSPQVLTVNGPNGVATSFSVTTNTSNCGGGWINVSPAGNLTTPQTLTVSVSAATNVGSPTQCTGTISLTSGGQTQTVQVVENIGSTGGGGSGNITVSPTSLSFSYQIGSPSTPGVQGLVVTSTSGSTGVGLSIATTTTSGGNWLSAGTTSATTPITLSINVNVTNLAAGTYQGNIRITPNGGTAVDVPVTLTVQSLSVSASPTNLSFNYRAGDAAPANQNITVTGVAGLTFSATASSNGNWLTVSPTTGTTIAGGNTLQVSINPANLAAGNYTGTITVAGTGTATGTTAITVSLAVTAPLPTITRVTNAASYATGSLSAGEIITIFGTNIGPTTLVALSQLEPNGKVGTTLGGVQVLVGGYPAAMLYARNDQVSAIVPYEIASPFLAGPNVVIRYLGQSSNGFPVTQVAAAPGIFTTNQSGTGPGAILNANSSVNTSGNPANKGETVVVYLTGEGQTSPAGVSASVTPVTVNTPKPLLPVAVLVDGQPAAVSFFGEAPGLVAGVLQVNVQIPANARSGNIPIQVNIGGASTQQGVTVSVR